MKNKVRKILLYIFVGLILLSVFFYYQNNSIVTTEYSIISSKVPQDFDGYRILQLSDLHSKLFGKNQHGIYKRVEKIDPDLIVFTGDLVDSKRYNEKNALKLMERMVQIAPVYFVTGNMNGGLGILMH